MNEHKLPRLLIPVENPHAVHSRHDNSFIVCEIEFESGSWTFLDLVFLAVSLVSLVPLITPVGNHDSSPHFEGNVNFPSA